MVRKEEIEEKCQNIVTGMLDIDDVNEVVLSVGYEESGEHRFCISDISSMIHREHLQRMMAEKNINTYKEAQEEIEKVGQNEQVQRQ